MFLGRGIFILLPYFFIFDKLSLFRYNIIKNDTMKNFIKNELKNWKAVEVLWIVTASAIILSLSIYWKENIIGIVSSISGILCVILTGKGKLSSYIFGMINTILYSYIAFNAKYYGEFMLNIFYYIPMNIAGFILWSRNLNNENKEVIKTKLNNKYKIIIFAFSFISIFIYGLILKKLGGSLPFVDSASTVFAVTAQILCIKRCSEQWIMWILVNILNISIWYINFSSGGDNIATLLMWSVYLVNALFMLIKWYKEANG